MSIGPAEGITGSAAGSPLAQTQGPEAQRTQQDTAEGDRRIAAAKKADAAAGVAEADGDDHEAEDRAADGRRPWEKTSPDGGSSNADCDEPPRRSEDATGIRGKLLDLSG